MIRFRIAFLTLACVLSAGGVAPAQNAPSLTVAAASDLQSVLPVIVSQFEKGTGQRVRVTFGSSGNFFAQIQNGAPFDVFMSADIEYPKRLEAAGQAERGSLSEYATGRIVLWTLKDSGIDVSRGLAVLTDDRVRRVAIANPQHAPYGRAAVAALRHERLYERIQPKLIQGENISQTAQFAQSGSVDVAIIALSLARGPSLKNAGAFFEIPESWYPPIEQGAVVIASSRRKDLARQFVDYLKKAEAAGILQSFGFSVPQPAR
jgi:molybdate transport system substrate-binding protein